MLENNTANRITTALNISESITAIKDLHETEIKILNDEIIQLKARTLQQEGATRTTNANQLDVPKQTTPVLGFGLQIQDRGGVQVGSYQINDAVYLVINAQASFETSLLVELKSDDGAVIWKQEHAVQDRMTVKFSIPGGLSAGTYSLHVSDGTIASSINFEIGIL